MKCNHIESACIIMPTYNEAENIGQMIESIFPADTGRQNTPLSLLIVDDSSPDGTADVVRSYQGRNANIHLLLRKKKEGLGAAYLAGMKYALENLRPDVIFEMDSDFSHDPNDIFRMLAPLWDKADFVIGSRYVPGGRVPEDWGAHRIMISRMANIMTRMILGIEGVRDCSGGFRAIHTDILRKIDLDTLDVHGYAFQAVILESVLAAGGRVTEVPIEFSNRKAGDSKMRIGDVMEGFTALGKVRVQRILSS